MEAVKEKRSVRIRKQKEALAAQPIQEAKAHLRYLRMPTRKVSVVLDLIRGEEVNKAKAILRHTSRAASEPLLKLLNSAVANAENLAAEKDTVLDVNNLYVSECFATEGPTLKRYRPMAKGRAGQILKRTSHVTMVVKSPENI